MFKTYLYRCLIFLIGCLPLGTLRMCGATLGNLAWIVRSRMWLVTRQNIGLCYPDLDPHRQKVLSKQSLQETGKTMAETCYAWIRQPEEVLGLIHTVEGKEAVDAAHSQNRPIIFIIPHLGNWEIINHYLGKHYGLTHMFQPNRNQRLSQYIQERRSTTGTRFVPTDRSGIKAQIKILRSGGCIGMMPDQEPLVHTGQFTPFFRIPALTNELIKGYSKVNCEIFTAVCERDSRGFVVKLDAVPLKENEDVLTVTNNAIEQAIRRQPAQYLWSYKRFRTRPDGQLDYYEINQHPLRTGFESAILSSYDLLLRNLTYRASKALSPLVPQPRKRKKITKINLKLTDQASTLNKPSMAHTIRSVLEAPGIWASEGKTFNTNLEVEQNQDLSGGAIILTPPLGSREALFKFLSHEHHVTEYYHSNPIESLDRFIRLKRNAMGIRLVPHSELGRKHLATALSHQEIVTLCPDQQPRLRGGAFVDFFGHPGLTTLALPNLLKTSEAPLYMGYALRDRASYRINLIPISYNAEDSAESILQDVNKVLEQEIVKAPDQYRWSDKRFNIQPAGQKKVYR